MPKIQIDDSIVTHITSINVDPARQRELLRLMSERARIMAKQPGFLSINLHRELVGNHIINYVQ